MEMDWAEFTNKSVDLADKLWQKYADDNDNAFYYRRDEWYDTVYTWTYRIFGDRNFITISFVNPLAETYTMTYGYPNSLEWVYDRVFLMPYGQPEEKTVYFAYGCQTDFLNLSISAAQRHYGGF